MRLHTSCSTLVAVLALTTLSGRPLGAQPLAPGARDTGGVGPRGPQIAAGTPVRLTVTDPAALPQALADPSPPSVAEGRFVGFDSAAVIVRLRGGRQYAYPASVVRRLEVPGAAIPRSNIWARRALWIGGGVASGYVAGRLFGRKTTSGTGSSGPSPRGLPDLSGRANERWLARRGVAVGAVVGVAGALVTSRRTWVPVEGWPSGG
jgi:hypothetical protein